MNAIMNKNAASLAGASIYVTMYPCNECAKLIIQVRYASDTLMSYGYIQYMHSAHVQSFAAQTDPAGAILFALAWGCIH